MIWINIICSNGQMFPVRSSVESKVDEFKDLLAQNSFIHIPANEQMLIYRGMILEDDQTLDAYGLQKHHTIYMEVAQNRLFAETETTPPSDTTTGLDRPTRGMPYMSQLMEEMIMIDIICSNGNLFSVRTSVGSKVVEFKDLLAQISRIPANAQSLIYRGKILKDDRSLYSYGLQADHAIHLEAVLNRRFAWTETTPPSNTMCGLGLQGLDRPTRGMPDMSQLILTISLMMQSFLSNPKYMKQIIEQNPQLHSMFDSIPQLREMMQNPEVVRRLTSPQLIEQMMSSPLLPELNQQLPPEQLYATQLSQLQETRFFDT